MDTKKISYKGEVHTVAEWARIFGLDKGELYDKLEKSNFSLSDALTYVNPKRERLIEYNGKAQNLTKWAVELNIPYYCLRSRLNCLKWTVDKAFTTPYEGEKK